MNRFTRQAYNDIDKLEAGALVSVLWYRNPAFMEQFKKKKIRPLHISKSVLKFAIRTVLLVNKTGKTMDGLNAQLNEDPYLMVDYFQPSGRFFYERDQGGFVSLGKNRKVSKWLVAARSEIDERKQATAWDQLRSVVRMGDVTAEPSLIKSCGDQHLYFMYRADMSEIKIGISFFPDIRRKQLKTVLRCDEIEILHIVSSGGRDLERTLHRHFSRFRKGRTEWFKNDPEIYALIKQFQNGDISADSFYSVDGLVAAE